MIGCCSYRLDLLGIEIKASRINPGEVRLEVSIR
jgi:hypothetical protein